MKTLLAALVALVPFGVSDGPTIEVRDVAAERAPDVHVVLRALDASGAPIAGLAEENFRLFEDGARVETYEVRQSHPEAEPVAVSFLIDVSGSMTAADVAAAGEGTLSVIEQLAPEDQYEIFAFDSEIRPVKAFDQPLDRTQLDALAPGSDTALNDAIIGAVDRIAAVSASERAVIVLTDGVDDGSVTRSDQVIAKAEQAKVKVFSIGLGNVDSGFLEQLSGVTGAQFTPASDGGQLAGLYSSIASSLMTEYRVSFVSEREPGPHDLNIVLTVDGQSASVTRSYDLGSATALAQPDEDGADGSSDTILAIIGVIVVVLLLVVLIVLSRRSSRRFGVDEDRDESVVTPLPVGTPVQEFHLVGEGGVFPIAGRLVLGRDPLADVIVGEETVSRSHAVLEQCDGGILVSDMGSANGTRVNGQPITSHVARPGDRIAFGDLNFELRAPTT